MKYLNGLFLTGMIRRTPRMMMMRRRRRTTTRTRRRMKIELPRFLVTLVVGDQERLHSINLNWIFYVHLYKPSSIKVPFVCFCSDQSQYTVIHHLAKTKPLSPHLPHNQLVRFIFSIPFRAVSKRRFYTLWTATP